MTRWLKVLLPILALGAGVLGMVALIKARPTVATRPPEVPPPLVRVFTARTEDLRLTVPSQGTVAPRTESQLVAEVAGRGTAVSPSLASGGFFETGDLLLTIDPTDYELAVVRARAQVAQAEVRLAREEEEATVARREWGDLGQGAPTALVLREPQLAEARAGLEAARAARAQAERDLARTRVHAPYAGRVRDKRADVGQYLNRGTVVATIYAVDYAEVRLPLPDEQLAHLDLPLSYRGTAETPAGPAVTLRARFAGREQAWEGRVVRTEGEIDPRSRMVHVVARVRDPYGKGAAPDRAPLAAGLFVQAELQGRLARNVVRLPRVALRGVDRVLVVDREDRLRFRTVGVLRSDPETVIIETGLRSGERVCLSPLEAVTDGMRVRAVAAGPTLAVPEEAAG